MEAAVSSPSPRPLPTSPPALMGTRRPQDGAHLFSLSTSQLVMRAGGQGTLEFHPVPGGCLLQTVPATPAWESLQDPCQEWGTLNHPTEHPPLS